MLAERLVAQQGGQDAHERHGGRDLTAFGALELGVERGQWRDVERNRVGAPRWQAAAQDGPSLAQVTQLRAVFVEADQGIRRQLLIRDRQAEPVAERLERLFAHLLLLVGDVLALARLAHAVALDGLGEDDCRLAGVLHGRGVGGVHLERIVATAVELPDLIVGPIGDHRRQLRVFAEEVLADIRAVLRLEVLVLAVDSLLHTLQQNPGRLTRNELVPAGTPQDFDDVPAGATEDRLELLDDLAVATHRSVEALQVAVDDEDQVVEFFPRGERDRSERLGLVSLAVAQERPHLAVGGVGQAAIVQVLEEARLVDRHDRPKTHRDGWELPEFGHEPRMGVRRQANAAHFLAEIEKLLLRQPSLEESAGIDAGRRVALDVDEIPAMPLRRRVPEPHEAGVVQRRGRLKAGDVAAKL